MHLGAFPVLKIKEALQVGVLSTANGAWLHSLVSSHHGQVSVVADLILCFIGCKVNELLFLSNINLRSEQCNFELRSLYTGIEGIQVSWRLVF